MNEKQRIEIVFGIRPKLKIMNRKLSRLARAVKYTSLNDVWLELDNRGRSPIDKGKITDAAFRRWRQNGRVSIKLERNGPVNGGTPGIIGPIRPQYPWITDSIFPIRPNKPVIKDTLIFKPNNLK